MQQRSSSLRSVEPETEAPEILALTGTVKWFDLAKGFGFIVPDNGMPDVLLHITCLRRSGYQIIYEGSKVACEASREKKGLQCLRVFSVDNSTAVLSRPAAAPLRGVVSQVFGPKRMTVKQFDCRRGFGFFTCSDEPDVFIHIGTLWRCGINYLKPGQEMMVSYGPNDIDSSRRLFAVRVGPCGG